MTTRRTERGPIARLAVHGLLAAAIAGTLGAATLTVSNTNDSGAGSLRAAVTGATTGDTIVFTLAAGSTITLTSGEIPITLGITITGPGAQALAVSGNLTSRIFNVTAPTATSISGMTLRNGKPVGGADGGGAILLNGGVGAPAITLTDLNITNNDVTLAGNPLGGGIDNEGASVTITRCSIVNNVATFRGGGIQNQGFGSMTIVNSTIAGNTAGTTGVGGGIRSIVALTLTNVTFFGNSAQTGGNVSRSTGAFNFQNTIIAGGILVGAGGTSADINGTVNSADYNLIQDVTGATITGTTTHNITGVSPGLGPLQNNGGSTPTLEPLSGSAVLDNGSAAGLTTDQRGLLRPVDQPAYVNAAGGDGSDIGAVEAQLIDHLTFVQQPTNAFAAGIITPAVTVRLVDIDGNVVASANPVVLTIGTNPGGGILTGTTSRAAIAGLATFGDLSISLGGIGYTLVATSGGVTGTSSPFTITGSTVQTPTLSETGLLLFAMVLVGYAAFTFRTGAVRG